MEKILLLNIRFIELPLAIKAHLQKKGFLEDVARKCMLGMVVSLIIQTFQLAIMYLLGIGLLLLLALQILI